MTTVVRLVVVPTIVAGVATLLWPRWLDYSDARLGVATAPVVVAAEEIVEGSVIDRASVAVAMWPAPTIPAGAYESVDAVIGRVARIRVFKGEPFVPARLAPAGATGGLDVRPAPGKRAYSIRVNDITGSADMIGPNSRVDVLFTLDDANQSRGALARILLSDVRVLAIGPLAQQSRAGSRRNSHVVTLELTPEEVERVAVAATQGSFSLALRGAP